MSEPGLSRAQQFSALAHASELAGSRLGTRQATVRLAGLPVQIDFAGDCLYELMTGAFGHVLSNDISEPALRLTVWDEATSGVPVPEELQPLSAHMATDLGRVPIEDGIVGYLDFEAAALSYLDLVTNRGYLWVKDAARLADRHRAAPFQTMLTWWLPRQGRFVVHAAAVGTDAGAVLLCGASGAGKSTTALRCLKDGFAFLSDDLCAVTTDGGPAVHSLYCTGKLHEHHLGAFPEFDRIVVNRKREPTEKAIAYLTDHPSGRLAHCRPLEAAIILTAKVEGQPRFRPIPPAKALRAIAPATLHEFPGFGREGFAGQAAVLSRVPCYEMDLSRQLDANPQALRLLLDDLGAKPEMPSAHGL